MLRYRPGVALIVVDVQNDFADPEGSLSVRGGADLVPVINREASLAANNGALVVYTQDWHPEHTPHFAKDGGIWPDHCIADTWGAEFHPALEVPAGAPIVHKGANGEDGYSGVLDARPDDRRDDPDRARRPPAGGRRHRGRRDRPRHRLLHEGDGARRGPARLRARPCSPTPSRPSTCSRGDGERSLGECAGGRRAPPLDPDALAAMLRRLLVLAAASTAGAWLADRWLARPARRRAAPADRDARGRRRADRGRLGRRRGRPPAAGVDARHEVRCASTRPAPIGVGTRAEATVRVLGIPVADPVVIVAFEPPTRYAIRHLGLFEGDGLFTLEPGADGTTTIVRWEERLEPPVLPDLGAAAPGPDPAGRLPGRPRADEAARRDRLGGRLTSGRGSRCRSTSSTRPTSCSARTSRRDRRSSGATTSRSRASAASSTSCCSCSASRARRTSAVPRTG